MRGEKHVPTIPTSARRLDLCRIFDLGVGKISSPLMRMHTVTLVSSEAAPCLHLRPILGCTNEIGSMAELLEELKEAYGRTRLFGRITTDSGNTSLGAMSKAIGHPNSIHL